MRGTAYGSVRATPQTAAKSGTVGEVRDGGVRGWLVVLGSHVCCVFNFGFFVVIGLFFVAIQRTFEASSASVSWILSLQMFLQYGLGPVSSLCVSRIGFRLTVGIGAFISSLGFFLSAFAPNVEYLYFSCGILVGVGYGLVTTASLGIVPLYIKKKYALANALVMTGAGTGALLLSPLIQQLIAFYGWRGAFIAYSAINAQMAVCATIYKRPNTDTNDNDETQYLKDKEDPGEPKRKRMSRSFAAFGCKLLVQYPSLAVISVSYLFGVGIGYFGAPSHLVARAEVWQLGSEQEIAAMMSIHGIGSIAGRLSVPVVLHFGCRRMTSLHWFGLAFLMTGVAQIISSLCRTYPLYTTYATVLGFLSGAIFTLAIQALKDIAGAEMVTTAFGLCVSFSALGVLIGPTCAGYIYDVTGDYNNSFYFYGAFLLLAGTIILMFGLITRKQRRSGYEQLKK